MKKCLPLFAFAVVAVVGLFATPADSLRFRADDFGLWHLEDNPAFMGLSGYDRLKLGASYEAMDAAGMPLSDGQFGNVKAAVYMPLLGYYGMNFRQNSFDLVAGTGLSFGAAFALGYDLGWSMPQNQLSYELGIVVRPTSFLSLGLTGSFDASATYSGGGGLALRPLALGGDDGPLSRALSLNADASFTENGGFVFDNIGLRLLFANFADVRGWYSPQAGILGGNGSIGLEVRLALGQAGVTVSAPSVAASSVAWRAAEDVDLSLSELTKRPSTLPTASFGRRVLVIKDLDAIGMAPSLGPGPLDFLSSSRTMPFPDLIAMLEKARRDAAVEAVAFEKLPPLAGAAYYQELAAELAALKKSGKKIYFYGEGFDLEYEIYASVADGITLNPLGYLGPTGLGLGYHRAYFKPLFDKLGIRFANLAPWDTKSAYNSFSDASMPPGEAAMMKRFYGDIQDQLELSLAAGRAGKLVGGIQGVLDSAPYLEASKALEAGLVDSLAYAPEFEDALRKAFPGALLVSGLGEPRVQSWGGPAFRRRAAVVWLSGSIGLGKGTAGRDIGSDAALALERLRKDKSIAGIVLRVDSPGGVVLTSDIIAREIRLAVEAGKPVVVSMGHYAASGGYYISAPASWIVAEPMTVTGSIGVTGLVPNVSEALAKLGINYDGFDLAPGASFLDPAKPQDEAELARTNAVILSVYDRFIGVVAAGRKMDPQKVRALAEGNIYSGREALKLGLVDQLGGLAEAKAYLDGKLGTSLAYVDILPGRTSPFAGLGPLAQAVATAFGQEEKNGIQTLLGPLAAHLQSLLDLGQGPLYYLDNEGIRF